MLRQKIIIALIISFIQSLNNLAYSNNLYKCEYHKIIKIIDSDTFYPDYNDDGIAQPDEKSRLNGVNGFEMKYYRSITQKEKDEFGLTYEEIYNLGYLGKLFAIKELQNKNVCIVHSAKREKGYYGRHLISVYYGHNFSKDYARELLEAGLAGIYRQSNIAKTLKPYLNLQKIKENAYNSKSLVVLNKNNKKYHKLSCKYGQSASNYKIIKLSKARKHYQQANCCFNDNYTVERISKRPDPVLKDDGTIKFYYIRARDYKIGSNQTRTEAGKALIEIINNAEKTVDFAFYGLAEQPEVLNALLNAQKRGVKIRGILDMNTLGRNDYTGTMVSMSKFRKGTIKTDLANDLAKKLKIDKKELKFYSDFYGHIMHNKFCIVDNKIVWTGTVNISSTGIGGFNENVAVLVHSKNFANIYTREMDEMFDNEKFHEAKEEIYTATPLLIGNVETDVYFSPSSHALTEGIIPEIRNAKEYIYISMFLISNYQIVSELINAKSRGVDVRLIIEANHAQQKYSLHEKLRKSNIPVKVENWAGKMHAKLAVIDNNTIIVGSTNWTKTGFKYNDENLMIFRGIQDSANFLKNEFNLSWNSIPNKWLTSNPKAEGADSPGSCSDGLDNDYNGLIDSEDPACFGVADAKKPSREAKQRIKPQYR